MTTWIVLPGMAETAAEFDRVRELLPELDLHVIDPWQTPVNADPAVLRTAAGVPSGEAIGLIGHSIGGLAAMRWALTRPQEVARLVLVDTTLPSESGRSWLYPGTSAERVVRVVLGFPGRIGLPWLVGPLVRRSMVRVGSVTKNDPLPKATIRKLYGDSRSWQRFWAELTASWIAAKDVSKLLPASGVPTVLLVATGGSSSVGADTWLAGQRELATALSGTVVVLEDSAHLVHLDRPDAIAEAVRTLRP
ncbi:alpha/beta hydrolase [Kribbella antibiotica]|uniref:Alpha/beta hydrolase n=1 Tax=Kribbella antibiotica TaxID=190195 RepID=A0A4R4YWC0_9ACTN|nr:alpha/beta hydrolase [Kribbella antibiotica]